MSTFGERELRSASSGRFDPLTPPGHLVARLGSLDIKPWLAPSLAARRCLCVFLIMVLRPSLARSVSIMRQATRVGGFQRRWQSNPRASQASQASWTTGTVLLFSAFASSVAFTYGTRFGSGSQRSELGERAPQYGNAEDLDKVIAHIDRSSGPDCRRVLCKQLNMWKLQLRKTISLALLRLCQNSCYSS